MKKFSLMLLPLFLLADQPITDPIPVSLRSEIVFLQRNLLAKLREADQICHKSGKIFSADALGCVILEVPKAEAQK